MEDEIRYFQRGAALLLFFLRRRPAKESFQLFGRGAGTSAGLGQQTVQRFHGPVFQDLFLQGKQTVFLFDPSGLALLHQERFQHLAGVFFAFCGSLDLPEKEGGQFRRPPVGMLF